MVCKSISSMMFLVVGLTVAWLCSGAFAGEASGRTGTRPSDDRAYFVLRDGLPNARVRFANKRKGRVAFLGGSITAAQGWRPMVSVALQKRFPGTRFDFVNAGISSTDSSLAPFRLGSTVFHRGQVDLLFVEFAVNDQHNSRSATERVRGMEGIIRQARRRNPDIDIIVLYCVDPIKMQQINAGKIPPEIVSHEKVARYYGIPSVDLAREVTERINAGEFDWQTFGGLHPAPFGHRLYARSIGHLFDAAWPMPLAADAKVRPHRMPAGPLDPLNYEHGRYVDLDQAQLASGWERVRSWTSNDAQTREKFTHVPMLVATEPGAVLRLQFTGTAVGILVVAGPDVGYIEFNIDGGPFRRVDQFTKWSAVLHIPWLYMLDADLKAGRHELTLRTASAKHPKSRGHAARIVKFVVN